MQKNKLLLIIGGGGIAFLILVILISGGSSKHSGESREGNPSTDFSAAARDSQVNTLAALTAEIQSTKATNRRLLETNQSLERRNRQLEGDIETIVSRQSRLDAKLNRVARNPQLARLDEYERMLEEQLTSANEPAQAAPIIQTSLPPTAAGPDPEPSILPSPILKGLRFGDNPPTKEEGFTWHAPTNRPDQQEDKSRQGALAGISSPSLSPQGGKQDKPEKIKRYTINPLATNFDGTAMTALVGRIPVQGKTEDPYRAKILIGKDSLAANGYFFEDVEGMLVGGWAVGDWNLSCVDVKLDSFAFIFSDGSIVAKEPDGEKIGYISMPNGFPCVPGEFHTNAPEFLAQNSFLSALKAAGQAYAVSETTQEDLPLGGSRTSVSGNRNKYVLGQVASETVDESLRWILERQQNSFDAVVAGPGQSVSVHFEKMIEIDYDPEGRKVIHESDREIISAHLD